MSGGTLNGVGLLAAAIVIRRWGIWTADVRVDSADTFEGAATLELGGLTLVGTVVDGDVYHQAGWWRVVGGAGGWREVIDAKGYRNAAGVKLSTVDQDAASAAGETLGTLPTSTVGPALSRPEGEASRVLDLLSEEGWYVDEQGTTQIGTRPAVAYNDEYIVIDRAPTGLFLTVAAEDISALLPGAQLEDIEVASVRHELTPDGLRSHLWALSDESTDDLDALFKDNVLSIMAFVVYHRRSEYRITRVVDGYVDLRPARTKLGLPDLANVPMRVGVPGGGGEPQLGSTALVSFIDGDPTRPFVDAYEGVSGGGFMPTKASIDASSEVKLGASAVDVLVAEALGRVLRSGEKVTISGLLDSTSAPVTSPAGLVTIALDLSMSTPGAPGVGYSKAKA